MASSEEVKWWFSNGASLLSIGDFSGALAMFRMVLNEPDLEGLGIERCEVLLKRAAAYVEGDRHKAALRDLDECIRLAQRRPEAKTCLDQASRMKDQMGGILCPVCKGEGIATVTKYEYFWDGEPGTGHHVPKGQEVTRCTVCLGTGRALSGEQRQAIERAAKRQKRWWQFWR